MVIWFIALLIAYILLTVAMLCDSKTLSDITGITGAVLVMILLIVAIVQCFLLLGGILDETATILRIN